MKTLFSFFLALPLVAFSMQQGYYVHNGAHPQAHAVHRPNYSVYHTHHHVSLQYRPVAHRPVHVVRSPTRPRPVIIHRHPQGSVHGHNLHRHNVHAPNIHGHSLRKPVVKHPQGAHAIAQVPGQVHQHSSAYIGQNQRHSSSASRPSSHSGQGNATRHAHR